MLYTTIMRFVIPEKAVTHFHLKEGDVVADFGSGTGYFLPALSAAVGADGTIYACEIQKNLVETMERFIKEKQLSNVKTLWCDFEKAGGSKLQDHSCDVVTLINTLFQIQDKSVVAGEIRRVLRPGGRAIVIDWTESFGGMGPTPDMVVTQQQTEDVFTAAGYTMETTFDAGDHHYGISFRV